MDRYELVISIIIISTAILMNHDSVSALSTESIVGGSIVYRGTFKYQVSVQMQLGIAAEYQPICGGCIIASSYILSAAHCFVDYTGEIKSALFSVVAGTIDLKAKRKVRKSVELVIIPRFEPSFRYYDIAILKLEKGIDLSSFLFDELLLPAPGNLYVEYLGTFAGYGSDYVRTYVDQMTGYEEVIDATSISFMKSVTVRIRANSECASHILGLLTNSQMCGSTMIEFPGQKWGICLGDDGGPLVIDNVVVGIASKGPVDCRDYEVGAVYTRVSSFINFIINVIHDRHLEQYIQLVPELRPNRTYTQY